jgi:putative ABC transport system substrate-binding protein
MKAKLVSLLAALFLAIALNAHADKAAPRVGFVSGSKGGTFDAFREGLRAAGYVEGKDLILEARFSEGNAERFPALIQELLEAKVDVLVAGSPPGALAAINAQTTTPIVIAGISDPVGLAVSMGRPAGHITGTTIASQALGGQWIELLRESSPGLRHAAVLLNPKHPGAPVWRRDLQASARNLGVELAIHETQNAAELEQALAAIEATTTDGLVVTGDPVFLFAREKLVAFAARRRLPAVYFTKFFADSGGMIAYGGSLEDSYRKSGSYIDRILKGARPSELPVESTGVELIVSRKAASAIGITLPETLIRRANRVID